MCVFTLMRELTKYLRNHDLVARLKLATRLIIAFKNQILRSAFKCKDAENQDQHKGTENTHQIKCTNSKGILHVINKQKYNAQKCNKRDKTIIRHTLSKT